LTEPRQFGRGLDIALTERAWHGLVQLSPASYANLGHALPLVALANGKWALVDLRAS